MSNLKDRKPSNLAALLLAQKIEGTTPRLPDEIIADAIKQSIVSNAKASLNIDEVMETSEYDKEYDKAKEIMKLAQILIMQECNFYGDDAIYQRSHTLLSYDCSDFFIDLANVCANELEKQS